jgi:hypothetical protein
MDNFDLISAVQPEDGWFVILGLDGNTRKQEIVATREEADEIIERFSNHDYNVFFGVAKFKTDESRKKDNVQALKAFWLDLDCGPDKAEVNPRTKRPDGYATQGEAVKALRAFVGHVGLPAPTVVNSGRGIHAYWILKEPVIRQQWEHTAARLRDVCHNSDLYVDNAVFEAARVMRVPGTMNHKEDPPKPVAVVRTSEPMLLEEFNNILGVKELPAEPEPDNDSEELKAFKAAIDPNRGYNFSAIMRKSLKGEGCAQLADVYENRETVSYMDWFYALTVAASCEDAETAVHKISEGHPDYDRAEVERKVATIGGSASCAKFQANRPELCEGCPHLGTIVGPKALGKVFLAAPEGESEEEVETEAGDTKTYKIPEYPFPFVRGKNGGIYLRPPKDAEDQTPKLVYPDDLYIVRRMEDPVAGEVALIRLHTPKDGVKEFTMKNEVLTGDRTELLKTLARKGVAIFGSKNVELLMQYMVYSYVEHRKERKADKMRVQFGWADNYSKFIIGDKEISSTGYSYSPPSSLTDELAEAYEPTGTLDEWKEVFNIYGREGFEAHAFAAATAFGAPLYHMSGYHGAVINLVHPSSGTGKTTALHMCNSVWGHPEMLCAKADDTQNSKVHKIGVSNTLPITFDEMTNITKSELSNLLYLITQGNGKDRMKGSSNELRKNLAKWCTIAVCSSNISFYEKLKGLKDSPQGEMMRVVEIPIDYIPEKYALDMEYAKEMFDHQLKCNYGHAGRIYARYIVENYEEVKKLYKKTQKMLDKLLNLSQRERFWSGLYAANITGIRIAVSLGLCDWDIKRISQWAAKQITILREQTSAPLDNDLNLLGDFLNRNMQHMLIVDDGLDLRSNVQKLPAMEPRLDTRIRYEPDTKKIFIVAKSLQYDCADRSINYSELMKQLKRRGIYVGCGAKRMNKGTKIKSLPVHALEFDGGHSEFLDMDDFAKTRTEAEAVADEWDGASSEG